MSVAVEPSDPASRRSRGRLSRVVWHAIGFVLAALLAYAVWRGYQSPDLLLDWGALRLC